MKPRGSRSEIRKRFRTRNAAFREILENLEKVAAHDVSILLTGESGVGKDEMAEAIHLTSPRRDRPLVRIDCASLPAELFESELFGYEKGAFTDAQARKLGKLELAQGGSVYFDEVSAIAPLLQAKLLRVIQEKKFNRLGGSNNVNLDVRFISSSNVPLKRLMESSEFRTDLFYRLNVVTFHLPPLRARREDIADLVPAFVSEASERFQKPIEGIEPEAMSLLQAFRWPGNVRQLRSVIERAVLLETTSSLTGSSLPQEDFVEPPDWIDAGLTQDWTLDQLESGYIREVLRRTGENYSKAAKILGINRKTLLEKRKRYGMH